MSVPDIEFAVEAFARELSAAGHDYKLERGPKGKWLLSCGEIICISDLLKHAIAASKARQS